MSTSGEHGVDSLRNVRIPRDFHVCLDDFLNQLKLEILKGSSNKAARGAGDESECFVRRRDITDIATQAFSSAAIRLDAALSEAETGGNAGIEHDNGERRAKAS